MTAVATVTGRRAGPLVAEVVVAAAYRLSPTFVRVELAGPALAEAGVDGPWLDQRIKLLFPGPSGGLPRLGQAGAEWYAAWRDLPEPERGHLRTYSVRDLRGQGADRRLVVDLVLHLHPAATGPGAAWAAGAAVGDRLVVVLPRRGVPFGGIEFAPGAAAELLIMGDETAVPAACRILEDLGSGAAGTAYLEVPDPADAQPVAAPPAMTVRWLARGPADPGAALVPAVLADLGQQTALGGGPAVGGTVPDEEVDPDLWETGAGAETAGAPAGDGPLGDTYAWVAGEAGMVTTVRRHLVRELGMERRQVAFMGYWRRGRAAPA